MSEFYPESILAERHLFTILMCALDRGTIKSTDVHDYIKNWGTIGDKLELLVEKELLRECLNDKGRLTLSYQLTEKGEFVARMLRCCDAAMDGGFDFRRQSVDAYMSGGKF